MTIKPEQEVERLREYITVALQQSDPLDTKALLREALEPPRDPSQPVRRDRHDATLLSKMKNRDRFQA